MADNPDDALLASEIRAQLARNRRTQTELAAYLGLSQSGISRRLAGLTPITVTELRAIAEFFGTSPMAFLPAAS